MSPASPVFGAEMTVAGWTACGTAAGATGRAGCGAAAGAAAAAQFTVTWAVPLAEPEVTVTVAVPPWDWGAVSTASRPLPWSTPVVGEMVPRLVARFRLVPGTLAFAVMKEELPQLRVVGAAETVIEETVAEASPPADPQSVWL